MKKTSLMGLALVAAAAVAGCCKCNADDQKVEAKDAAAEAPKNPAEAVATVNGKTLTRGELDAAVDALAEKYKDQIPADQIGMMKKQAGTQVVQQFIIETILKDKAESLKYTLTEDELKAQEDAHMQRIAAIPDAPKTFEELLAQDPRGKEKALESFKTGALIDKMLKEEVVDKDTTDYTADAQKIIDRIKEENAKCVSDEGALAKIKELKAQLDAAKPEEKAELFGKLAEEHSACPSGKRAKGDLGEFGPGQMVKEFDDAARALEVGAISEPVKTSFGYHLIMTTKKDGDKIQASHILIAVREPQEVPEIDQVKSFLAQNNTRPLIAKFIQAAYREAKVDVADEYKELLPPAEEN
ncbi:MAG: peptidylprolyl isomerase [Kiritimatiellae bacterium]|nr:peptidylprolyl isomerase [Kiritimatiellia bacterium]